MDAQAFTGDVLCATRQLRAVNERDYWPLNISNRLLTFLRFFRPGTPEEIK